MVEENVAKLSFSTLRILATVKLWSISLLSMLGFSTLRILATVKLNNHHFTHLLCFSTLRILATVKLLIKKLSVKNVLVPLEF